MICSHNMAGGLHFIQMLNDSLNLRDGLIRNLLLTTGFSIGTLFCVKFALQSRRGKCKNNVLLEGKTCIITGANSGIGKAVAMELARRRARVIMACRDVQRANQVADEIRSKHPEADLKVMSLDLAELQSVRHFASEVTSSEGRVDILINNAGIFQCPFMLSQDGVELQFAVNHLGHFLLTNLLLNNIEHVEDGRIIVVSSGLYKHASMDLVNYNQETAYTPQHAFSRSKLANIMFTNELAKRVRPGVSVNSLCPNKARTNVGRYQLKYFVHQCLLNMVAFFLVRSAQEAAETVIYMATEPSLKGVSGKYFKDCKEKELHENAKDTKVAEKLWELSEKLTGLS